MCTCTHMETSDNLSFLKHCPLLYLKQVLSPSQHSPGGIDGAPPHKSTPPCPSSCFHYCEDYEALIRVFEIAQQTLHQPSCLSSPYILKSFSFYFLNICSRQMPSHIEYIPYILGKQISMVKQIMPGVRVVCALGNSKESRNGRCYRCACLRVGDTDKRSFT